MTPPSTLSGARRAILRSLYVAVFSASLTALVMCVLPGYSTVYAYGGPRIEPAGGPLLALAMIPIAILAAIGLVMPRRETTVLAAGAASILTIPISIWFMIAQRDEMGRAVVLWPAVVLDLALPVVVFAGPLIGVVGFVLFHLETRALRTALPSATVR